MCIRRPPRSTRSPASTSASETPRAVIGLNSRREPTGTMRTAVAGISRSDGKWAWSACRWEISTMSARAACGGGAGPRTRRRWPTRAVRAGSNRTVVSPSCQVLVLCPHQVSVAVMACPPEAGCCQITARYGRSEAERVSTAEHRVVDSGTSSDLASVWCMIELEPVTWQEASMRHTSHCVEGRQELGTCD